MNAVVTTARNLIAVVYLRDGVGSGQRDSYDSYETDHSEKASLLSFSRQRSNMIDDSIHNMLIDKNEVRVHRQLQATTVCVVS